MIKTYNNYELFNVLLEGCKLEIIEENDFETILHTNIIFSGSGPAQPYLNYALMNIIAIAPQNKFVRQHESILISNISCLNLSTIFDEYDKFGYCFDLRKFVFLKKLKFSLFGFETNICLKDSFKNDSVQEIIILKADGTLKWLEKFKKIETLELSGENFDNYEVLNYLPNLKELNLRNWNNIECKSFFKNCTQTSIIKFNINLSLEDSIETIEKVLNSLKYCEKLQSLEVRFEDYYRKFDYKKYTQTFDKLFKTIENCDSLESVNVIKGCPLTIKVNTIDFYGLKDLSTLNTIKVNNLELISQ